MNCLCECRMSSGAYILCFELIRTQTLVIGKLGSICFEKGFYFYVGSAFNQKQKYSLEKRVIRHLKSPENKRFHWHIDYLLSSDEIIIHSVILVPSSDREECEIAEIIKNKASKHIPNFGCSDCACSSHLFFSAEYIF